MSFMRCFVVRRSNGGPDVRCGGIAWVVSTTDGADPLPVCDRHVHLASEVHSPTPGELDLVWIREVLAS